MATRESLIAAGRSALEPTPEGARLRRRFLAVSGFTALVFSFLVVIGLGELAVLSAVGLTAAASVGLLLANIRRRGDLGKRALHIVQVFDGCGRAGWRALTSGRVGAQRRHELWRKGEAFSSWRPRRARPRKAARLNAHGTELRRRSDFEGAIAAHTAALATLRELGDRSGEAMTLNNLGLALGHAGDEAGAVGCFERAADILRELRDAHHEGQVVANLALLHGRRGRREQALSYLETALEKLDRDSQAYRRVQDQLRRAS